MARISLGIGKMTRQAKTHSRRVGHEERDGDEREKGQAKEQSMVELITSQSDLRKEMGRLAAIYCYIFQEPKSR